MNQEQYEQYAYKAADFLFLGGSNAYGTNQEGSDEDVRGVFVAPAGMMTNPFFDFRRDVVKHSGHEDLMLWELSFYMNDLDRAPDRLDGLFVPKDCWIKSPGKMTQGLMNHRQEFLTHRTVQALLGHARRDMAMLKKGKFISKDELVEPRHIDYCFRDKEMTERFSRSPRFIESQGKGYALKKVHVDGETIQFSVYRSENRSMLNAEGFLSPMKGGEWVASCDFVDYLYFDRGRFDRAHVAYKNRMNAPERTSAKAALAEKHGFDTKTAANSLRCARLAHELALTGVYQPRRPDAEELLDIRNNASRTLDSIMEEIQMLNDYALSRLAHSNLPERMDYEKVGQIYQQAFQHAIAKNPGYSCPKL